MKKLLFWLASAAIIFTSCSKEPAEVQGGMGKGSLRIATSVNAGIDLIQTRAGEVPDPADFSLFLQKAGGEAQQVAIPADGIIKDLDAGTYTVTLTSHPAGFTSPVFGERAYECVKEVIIKDGQTAHLIMECCQSNAGVYFVYDESLEKIGGFTDVRPTLSHGHGTLDYAGDKKEAVGYFAPGAATLSVKNGAETILIGGQESQTIQLKAKQLWEITLKVTAPGSPEEGKLYVIASVIPVDDPTDKVEFDLSAGEDGDNPDNPTPPVTGDVELDKMYGYATAGTPTTGGEGGTVHHFDNGAKLQAWLNLREKNKSTDPAVVWLSGTFTESDGRSSSSPWFDVKRTSNITFYGTDDFVMDRVGFFLVEASNIIIRNIYIKMPKASNGADGISMQKSNNIWVDHCTFESLNQTKDYEDGSCDITHGTYNVTVSWCHFIKTQKSSLVGHSNSESGDTKITVTYHHNFFDESSSRHPRVRYGRAHVYNNYFNAVTTYGVGSAYGAMVLVENNYFESVVLPTDICTYPAKKGDVSNLQGSVAGYLYETGNIYSNKPDNARDPYPLINVEYTSYNGPTIATPYVYNDFKPAYEYVVDPVEDIPAIVASGSGTKKLTGYATAPVAVDNGGMPDSGGTDPEEPGTPEEPEGVELANGWYMISHSEGSYTANAAVSLADGALSLTACGKYESKAQNFGLVYREISGDFTITAKLDSYTPASSSNQALTGIMVTPDPASTSTNLLFGLCAKGGDGAFHNRNRLATASDSGRSGITAPGSTGGDTYLKVERTGNNYKAYVSLDSGATWSNASSKTFTELSDTVYVGLAVNSGDNSKTATAVFSDIKINGEPAPEFTED